MRARVTFLLRPPEDYKKEVGWWTVAVEYLTLLIDERNYHPV